MERSPALILVLCATTLVRGFGDRCCTPFASVKMVIIAAAYRRVVFRQAASHYRYGLGLALQRDR